MGCCASVTAQSPRVSPHVTTPQKDLMNGDGKKTANVSKRHEIHHPCQAMFGELKKIMSGVTRIPRPEELDFVVCLSDHSLPLAICPIAFEEGEPSPLQLPIIGIAQYESGRLVAVGNIEILTDCKQENAEFLAFLENILHFAAGPRPPSAIVYLLDLDPQDATMLHHNMGGLGFVVEQGDNTENLAKYAVVIALNNSSHGEILYEYTKNGGGLICCSSFHQSFVMNRWLSKCGLAFPDAHITLPMTQKASIRTALRASELEHSTFPFFVEAYKDILLDDKPDPIELTNIVNYLRYHILCIERMPNIYLTDIMEKTFEFLKMTNYEQPEGIFYSDVHGIIAVLLSDVINHLDPNEFIDHTFCDHFPGYFVPEKYEESQIKITLQTPTWHSTGLWLPAGVISVVTLDDQKYDNVSIQIGCHSESLLGSPGPWKRWPVVVLTFPLSEKSFKIGSPFGGLLYIVNENTDAKARAISLKVSNVCHCPYYTDKDRWISTRSNEAPWAEVQTKFTSITVPSDIVKKMGNLEPFAANFDKLVKEMLTFIGYNPKRRFRIVFDIDQPKSGSTSSYPLMLSYDSIESIFEIDAPSSDLFGVMMMMAIVSLPESALDPNVEAAFGALAAAHAFVRTWKESSPLEFIYDHMSPIFNELWKVYTHNDRKLVPTVLTRFHQHYRKKLQHPVAYEESIKYIVDEMTSIADKDFSNLLQEALHPSASASMKFPEYRPIGEEEEEEKEQQ